MTITLSWWMIPTIITVGGIVLALFIHRDEPGFFHGLGNMMLLVPVLFISMIAWIVAAVLK